MEFTAVVQGESYHFASITKSSFLVSGNYTEYILYKSTKWLCADEISKDLLSKLGQVIDERARIAH